MNKTVFNIYCSGDLVCTIINEKDIGSLVQAIINTHWNDQNIVIARTTIIDTKEKEEMYEE